MRRYVAIGVLLPLLTAGCGPSVDSSAVAEPAEQALQLQNLRSTLATAHDKFNALADATPEQVYGWRPMEGVRSVGEVFRHVAADNYFVPSLMGIAPPADTGVTSDVETFRAFQEAERSKAEIVDHVNASFEFMLGAMDDTAGELDRSMMLGQSETTVGDVWIRAVTHLHEHLGQSIAYARSNEIVPPWSR